MADSLEMTATAQFISLAMKELEQGLTHDLIWIHHSNLGVVWDAPFPCREQFFSEEDPEVAKMANPPFGLNKQERPGWNHADCACLCQVSVLDTCLGFLLDQIQTRKLSRDDPANYHLREVGPRASWRCGLWTFTTGHWSITSLMRSQSLYHKRRKSPSNAL